MYWSSTQPLSEECCTFIIYMNLNVLQHYNIQTISICYAVNKLLIILHIMNDWFKTTLFFLIDCYSIFSFLDKLLLIFKSIGPDYWFYHLKQCYLISKCNERSVLKEERCLVTAVCFWPGKKLQFGSDLWCTLTHMGHLCQPRGCERGILED